MWCLHVSSASLPTLAVVGWASVSWGNATSDVALRVARCEEVDRARDDEHHPCRQIVELQADRRKRSGQFQVPEAWAGSIESAKIVFVSSNPSISEDGAAHGAAFPEEYPRHSWSDSCIVDFITRRFEPDAKWTRGNHFLCQNGTYAPKEVVFWSLVQKRACELVDQAAPGRDYVMTEIVHCKSQKEAGVTRAARHCFDRHFEAIIRLSPAPLVVVLGAKARDLLRKALELGPRFGSKATVGLDEQANLAVRRLGGHDRVVSYLWHPTGMTARKTFALSYPSRISELRRLVRGEMSVSEFAYQEADHRYGPKGPGSCRLDASRRQQPSSVRR